MRIITSSDDRGLGIGKRPLVAVVDDSDSVRESLPDLLEQAGWAAQAFESAEAFLDSAAADDSSCLILDVALPRMSGPELQLELLRRGKAIPIVFITAQVDQSLRPRLVAQGAVACLFKPFSDTALLEAVEAALETNQS
jgi:FixJ family two-component response regulator